MAEHRRGTSMNGALAGPEVTCPHCLKVNDCHDEVHDPHARPEAGDVAICYRCGGVAIFTGPATQRKATEAELTALAQQPRMAEVLGLLASPRTPHQAVAVTRWRARRNRPPR